MHWKLFTTEKYRKSSNIKNAFKIIYFWKVLKIIYDKNVLEISYKMNV